MSRPLRIEFPGALYQVTSRGNARLAIYHDDEDRHLFLKTLQDAPAVNMSMRSFGQATPVPLRPQ
jgi:hypothetical protein